MFPKLLHVPRLECHKNTHWTTYPVEKSYSAENLFTGPLFTTSKGQEAIRPQCQKAKRPKHQLTKIPKDQLTKIPEDQKSQVQDQTKTNQSIYLNIVMRNLTDICKL